MPGSKVILHVSDVHCAWRALERILKSENYDIVTVSGDLECLEAVDVLKEASGEVVAVTGNMDDVSLMKALRESGMLVEGSIREVGGIRIAGVSGLDPVTSIDTLKDRLGSGAIHVLLTHHPPKGVVDRTFLGISAGLKELRGLIEELGPLVHLCGHIHEARGTGTLGSTLIVNPGPAKKGYYAIVELDPGTRDVGVELRRLRW